MTVTWLTWTRRSETFNCSHLVSFTDFRKMHIAFLSVIGLILGCDGNLIFYLRSTAFLIMTLYYKDINQERNIVIQFPINKKKKKQKHFFSTFCLHRHLCLRDQGPCPLKFSVLFCSLRLVNGLFVLRVEIFNLELAGFEGSLNPMKLCRTFSFICGNTHLSGDTLYTFQQILKWQLWKSWQLLLIDLFRF